MRCEGSGLDAYRMGMVHFRDSQKYVRCPVCERVVSLTVAGLIRKHDVDGPKDKAYVQAADIFFDIDPNLFRSELARRRAALGMRARRTEAVKFLHVALGIPQVSIARVYGVSKQAVSQRLQRAGVRSGS